MLLVLSVLWGLSLSSSLTSVSQAYETDQLRGRHLVVPDVTLQVDSYVNHALERARLRAREKFEETDESISLSEAEQIVRDEVIEEFPWLKLYFGTPMEKWMTEVLAPKGYAIEPGGPGTGMSVNIYDRASRMYRMNPLRDLPTPAMVLSFANAVSGTSLAPTFMSNGVRYGADKWSHFFRLGYRYYMRSKGGTDTAAALAYGTGTEQGGVGYMSSGALSYADLAANYDGYRFFRDLFDSQLGNFSLDLIEKTQRIGRSRKFRMIQTWDLQWIAPFRSIDYVSHDWDEYLNPNVYRPHFLRAIRLHLQEERETVCREYSEWREEAKYQKYTLRDKREYVDLSQSRPQVEPFGLEDLCGYKSRLEVR